MTSIEKKRNAINSDKQIAMKLKKAESGEKNAGSGGTFQEFKTESGVACNIYAHHDIGTFEVHGDILTKYLAAGGPGKNPKTGNRDLGFPKSDTRRTPDGYAHENIFEWGSIYSGYKSDAVAIYGKMYHTWKNISKSAFCGYPLMQPYSLKGGNTACIFENAIIINMSNEGNAQPQQSAAEPRLNVVDHRTGTHSPAPAPAHSPTPPDRGHQPGRHADHRSPGNSSSIQVHDHRDGHSQEQNHLGPGNINDLVGSIFGGSNPNNIENTVIHFKYRGPLVGRPHISEPGHLSISNCYRADIPKKIWDGISADFQKTLDELAGSRFAARSVGSRDQVRATLKLGSARPLEKDANLIRVRITLEAVALKDRTLYDIGILDDDSKFGIIGLHSIYAKNKWEAFGVMHATDLHLSKTNDRIYRALLGNNKNKKSYKRTAENEFVNFNDNFRDFVRYANKLYKAGQVDIIMLTGDLIDFQHETFYDAAAEPFGNFYFLQRLIQGKSESPKESMEVEELLVPTLMCLGNHDYRNLSYLLNFGTEIKFSDFEKFVMVDTLGEIIGGRTGEVISFIGKPVDVIRGAILDAIGPISDVVIDKFIDGLSAVGNLVGGLFPGGDDFVPDRVIDQSPNFGQYNLIYSELDGIYESKKPKVSPMRALQMIAINEPSYYYNRLNNGGDGYTVTQLGKNAIMMLETGHDKDVPNEIDHAEAAHVAFDSKFGTGGESRQNMIGGDPDLVGITKEQTDGIKLLLNNEEITGSILIGMHGPLINVNGNDYPPYFRESVFPARKHSEVEAFLNNKYKNEDHAPWLNAIGKPYFTTGKLENRLDSGASQGLSEEFVKLCAGVGVRRPIDMVLSGHIHRNVEFRIKWDAVKKQMEYFYDFYTENPEKYYNTHLKSANDRNSVVTRIVNRSFVNENEAIETRRVVNGKRVTYYQLVTKPNADTLAAATDKAAWWNLHKPLIIQTAALGPLEGAQRDDPEQGKDRIPEQIFQGFRVIKVKDNVIDKVHYVTLSDLRKGKFNMPWEKEDASHFKLVHGQISAAIVGPGLVTKDPV